MLSHSQFSCIHSCTNYRQPHKFTNLSIRTQLRAVDALLSMPIYFQHALSRLLRDSLYSILMDHVKGFRASLLAPNLMLCFMLFICSCFVFSLISVRSHYHREQLMEKYVYKNYYLY